MIGVSGEGGVAMAQYTDEYTQQIRDQDMAAVYEHYRQLAEHNRGEVEAIVARLSSGDVGQ